LLNNWVECPTSGKKKKEPTPLLKVCKRKSVFWDWHILGTPHCLDVMHITKNVCESLLATLFNMPDKIKDGPKARKDLIDLNIRHDLQVRKPPQETTKKSTSGKRLRITRLLRRCGWKVNKG
jgi:hypothetical protein